MTVSGTPLVSPKRKPASSARSTGESESEPRSTARRTVFATLSSGARAHRAMSSSSVACRVPTAWCHRHRESKPRAARANPAASHPRPHSAGAVAGRASPDADASRRRRPPAFVRVAPWTVTRSTRTSTRARETCAIGVVDQSCRAPSTSSRASIGAGSGDTASPCSARCITAVPSSANASTASTTRAAGLRDERARPRPATRTETSSATRAGPGPACSPTTMPATSPARTSSGPTGAFGVTR